MPGLLNRTTGAALPLMASDVTSFVSGYALGLTASLTYGNLEAQPFQGLFLYPLDESTTVIGFEAVIAERVITVQIKDKAKLGSDHAEAPHTRGSSITGKVALDEDLERSLFVVNLGTVTPMENVTVFISTSSELPTLPSGAVRVQLPAVCAPKVPQFCAEDGSPPSQQAQGPSRDRYRLGTRKLEAGSKLCLATLLDTEVSNPMEYEFNFQLEIRGPCLLAGVESPTHEIRADAAPSACSAKSVIVTLANKHTFDRPVEILIHPSEPHLPHILMEKGDMTLREFAQHLKGRADFIRGVRKNSSAERKTEIIRKRLHKDIPHHSVIMLNFCPDLQSIHSQLRKGHGEFIFLLDRSSSMSAASILQVKDAMLVALKSLMPTCLFNIIGFGSTFKTLFPSSQMYNEENLAAACEDLQNLRPDMGGTNILAPLKWVTRQPVHRGHPRLLFLVTDGATSNTGKVLELARNHAFSTRCYSFGIGSGVCRRLVSGLARVSKGSAEFLMEGERLQPKMVRSLKKAMAPALSDVTVDWVFPETTEVLISPVSTSSLFPGERLVGYGIVCDASLYTSSPRADKHWMDSKLRSQESYGSVFYHSQEEGPSPDSGDCAPSRGVPPGLRLAKGNRPSCGDTASDTGLDLSQRRRPFSTTQITGHKPPPRAPTASDPTPARRHPLRKAKLQDLRSQASTDGPWGQIDLQPLLNSGQDPTQVPKLRGPGARRPSLLPQDCQPVQPQAQETQSWSPRSPELKRRPTKAGSDSHSPGDTEIPQASSLDTQTSSDLEPPAEAEEGGGRQASPGPVLGKAVVRALHGGQRLQWEVCFELGPPGLEREGDLWSETFHHLAARAIIRDFEQLAEREADIEQGSSRRYQVSAVHTSKACNVISKYTAFVPVDVSQSRYLPTLLGYPGTGAPSGTNTSQVRPRQWRGMATSFSRSQTGDDAAAADGKFQSLSGKESPPLPFGEAMLPAREKHAASEGSLRNLATNTFSSLKSSETLFGSRLNLNKSRLLTRAAKGLLNRPLGSVPEPPSTNQSSDYMPLVSLQLASGAFLLNQAFCEAVHIPMEKLKWTSPFPCHRVSLMARPPQPRAPSPTPRSPEPLGEGKPGREARAVTEHTGKLWATEVALAWLEHSAACSFIEWELVAAKASSWLEQQPVPEGRTRGSLKAAARQLFVLLRHWDDSLEFNMLCYNPNSV